MPKLLISLFLIVFTLFLTSCIKMPNSFSYEDYLERQAEILAKSRFYSEVEPTGKQPKARLTVIQVGANDFSAKGMQIYDLTNKNEYGYLSAYRFGDDNVVPPVSQIHGVSVPDDYVNPLNQINIVPEKPFIFSVRVSKYNSVKAGWFRRGYTETFTCKWNDKKLFFVPKKDSDYLLTIGAKPTEDVKKFICILRLQEWDKKAKEYKNTPFILYPEKQ